MQKRFSWMVSALCAVALSAAAVAQMATPQMASAAPKAAVTYYVDPAIVDPGLLIPPPPAAGSVEQAADLAEVHSVQGHASPDEIKFAQEDAKEQDLFIYATVLGPGFRADALPATALLSAHLMNDASVMNGILKARYLRPRPVNVDSTLLTPCGKPSTVSYPSGHSMSGYFGAYTMAQIVPEKAKEILARADLFALHRVVCAVHYPTDIQEGRIVSLEVFGSILTSPRFQKELAAARAETRAALHLDH